MNYSTMSLTLADAASAPPPPPAGTPQQPGPANTGGNQTTGGNTSSTGTPGGPTKGSNPQQQPQSTGLFGNGFILIVLVVLAFMWIFMISNQRKEKKKRKQMLEQVTKGAKVQSIGGIIGTVVDVRGDEIVVKVDENANTRLRFSRNAIQTVLDDKSDS